MEEIIEETQFDLSHPEMFSSSQLYKALKEKKIQVDMAESNLDKDKLLEIFYRTLMPLPQREYRLNRRGRLLTRKQEKLKRNFSDTSPTNKTEGKIANSTLPLSSSPSRSPSSSEKKTAKLSNGTSSVHRHSSPNHSKRSTSSSSSSSSRGTSHDNKSHSKREAQQGNESSPKKKHKQITWP